MASAQFSTPPCMHTAIITSNQSLPPPPSSLLIRSASYLISGARPGSPPFQAPASGQPPPIAVRMSCTDHWPQGPQPHPAHRGDGDAEGEPRKKVVGEGVPVGVWEGELEGVGVPVAVGEGVVEAAQLPPRRPSSQGAATGVGEADAEHQGQGAPVGDGPPPTRHAAARLRAPVKAGLGRHVAGVRMRERGAPSAPHVLEPAHVVKLAPVAPRELTPNERTGVSM